MFLGRKALIFSNKKPHLFFRNGVYSNFQTMQPPGYPDRVKVKG
jgi:hypothetical protein